MSCRVIGTIMAGCMILVAGCAEPGPLQARRTTIGTLKASVSHLEFEKEQLAKELADLKAENRRAQDRLVQEEEANGELSARLDDARVLLRSRGYDTDSFTPPSRPAQRDDAESGSTRKARQRRNHKPPFARIPGHVDSLNAPEDTESSRDEAPAAEGTRASGSQTRHTDPSGWMPVARGDAMRPGQVR